MRNNHDILSLGAKSRFIIVTYLSTHNRRLPVTDQHSERGFGILRVYISSVQGQIRGFYLMHLHDNVFFLHLVREMGELGMVGVGK